MIGRPYAITDYTLTCALGHGCEEVLGALAEGRSGLVPAGADRGLPFDTWFGAFRAPEPAPLPLSLQGRDTAQARRTVQLLSPMRASVQAAVARWGPARVGVIVGTTTGGQADTEAGYPAFAATGVLPDAYDLAQQHVMQATPELLAALVGAQGPCWAQSSACSSSTKVFGTARRLLDLGVVDAVLVGGIDTWCHFTQLGFRSLEVLSSERCTPFAEHRQGINLGEGGALALIEREGTPRAWLRGVGETSDAFHMTQPHPEGAGLARAIHQALSTSGVSPSEVGLVQAHATGTTYNDAAEAKAIAQTLGHRPPVVGTKGHTGHTLGASGAVEAVLGLLALEQGWSPGTLTSGVDPTLDIDVRTERVQGPFRYVLDLSAAFAGHNGAVLLEAP